MKRAATLMVGSIFAASLFAACSDDDSKSGGDGGTAQYCARIATYIASADSLDSVFVSATPDPAALENAFTTMQTGVHDLQNGAPDEIADDVDTMAGAIDNVVTIMSKYDWDFAQLQVAPDFAQLQEDLAGAEMGAASGRLTAYSESTCGLSSGS